MKKKFNIAEVPTLAVTLGIIAIVLGLVATILVQVQSTQITDGYAYNISQQGVEAVSDLASWQSTWVVIIAAAIVIMIVGAYLFFRPRG